VKEEGEEEEESVGRREEGEEEGERQGRREEGEKGERGRDTN
jgi:hypothetical protein